MDAKMKHLEFIQAAISRFSDHSFKLKGWAVVLLVALGAISARESNGGLALLACIPIAILWGLDGYYLSVERQYRALFDCVRSLDNDEIDFTMKIDQKQKAENGWLPAAFSTTLCLFYGSQLASVLLLYVAVTS
ncbi:MAG: hypothetical protein GKR94_28020 [Gammaproteobacteria bacterium]|nr:hypothetical protein [Gammaproteobacteria bacterium]